MEDFKGKTIMITGASSGLGKCITEYLDQCGANIVMVARNAEAMREIQTSLINESYIIENDLSQLEHIGNIFEALGSLKLKLDGLVHCAGSMSIMPLKMMDTDVMQNMFDVNLLSFIEIGKYISSKKYMNNDASVIAMSSTAVKSYTKGHSVYAATKSGLNTVVKIMAKELLKRHIRVNSIMPAIVDTQMGRSWLTEVPDREGDSIGQPLGFIEPLQVAYLAEFLMSDRAKYITGDCITIGAGYVW